MMNLMVTVIGCLVFLMIVIYYLWLIISVRSQDSILSIVFRRFAFQVAGTFNGLADANVINYITANIQRTKFQSAKHTSTKVCPICLSEFTEGTDIIELPCDNRHYFHTLCIQTWIENHQNISCPLCKKDINAELHKVVEKKQADSQVQGEIKPEQKENQVVINVNLK